MRQTAEPTGSKLSTYKSSNSRSTDTTQVVKELVQGLASDQPPSLVLVFASPHYDVAQLTTIAEALQQQLQTANVMGCTGEAVIADGMELEDEIGISAWAASWPDAGLELEHLRFQRDSGRFSSKLNIPENDATSLVLLADAFSFPADVLLAQLNETHPRTTIVGGMASGGTQPGEAKLILGDQVFDEGAVVAKLHNANMRCVVSQGCRPIGESFVITKAERNEIFELGGKPAHDQLNAIYARLPTRDKDLMRKGIQLGRVVNEYQESFDYGDFLVRNVSGFHPQDGSITVGDYYRPGQTVQFQLRDAASASQELETLLRRCNEKTPAKSALLFTCNGRGTRLFEDAHHDAGKIQQIVGQVPCAGFFCAGEIGPIGLGNFVHGFTASVALFS